MAGVPVYGSVMTSLGSSPRSVPGLLAHLGKVDDIVLAGALVPEAWPLRQAVFIAVFVPARVVALVREISLSHDAFEHTQVAPAPVILREGDRGHYMHAHRQIYSYIDPGLCQCCGFKQ